MNWQELSRSCLTSFLINETIVPVMTKQSTDLALYAFGQKNIPEGKENFTFPVENPVENVENIHFKNFYTFLRGG